MLYSIAKSQSNSCCPIDENYLWGGVHHFFPLFTVHLSFGFYKRGTNLNVAVWGVHHLSKCVCNYEYNLWCFPHNLPSLGSSNMDYILLIRTVAICLLLIMLESVLFEHYCLANAQQKFPHNILIDQFPFKIYSSWFWVYLLSLQKHYNSVKCWFQLFFKMCSMFWYLQIMSEQVLVFCDRITNWIFPKKISVVFLNSNEKSLKNGV